MPTGQRWRLAPLASSSSSVVSFGCRTFRIFAVHLLQKPQFAAHCHWAHLRSWRALCARALAFAMPTRKLLYRLNLLRLCTHSTVLMLTRYGTLGQNKIRDVATICAYKNKRTSPEHFSLRNKAHRALLRNEKFLKKSLVFEAAQIVATSPYQSEKNPLMYIVVYYMHIR